jgi:hypothetical protein
MYVRNARLRARLLRDGNGDPSTGTAVGGGGGSSAATGSSGQNGASAGQQNQAGNATGQPATGAGQQNGQGSGEPGQQAGQSDEPLGPQGMSALRTERELKAAEKRRADAAEEELRKIREANQTDQERALNAAREEGRQQAATVANVQLVRFATQAAAATAGFADPMDAVAWLQSRAGEITVTAQGAVDEAAVTAMVKKLAEEKPYLLAQQQNPAFVPNPGQGAGQSGGGATKGSVSAGADLYRQRNQKQQ